MQCVKPTKRLLNFVMTFAALCLAHEASAVVLQAESFNDAFYATAYCPTIGTTWFCIGGCNNQRAAEEL